MKQIAALIAASLLAFGLAAPAQAEGQPWYMPQPWMHPQQTGPNYAPLPGQYGHFTRQRAYGSFGTYCYGSCGYRTRPGTIATGSGVILSSPVVAIYDGDQYSLVSRDQIEALQAYAQQTYAARQAATTAGQAGGAMPAPARYAIRNVRKAQSPFTMQNGVRIIRPSQSTY